MTNTGCYSGEGDGNKWVVVRDCEKLQKWSDPSVELGTTGLHIPHISHLVLWSQILSSNYAVQNLKFEKV